MLVSSFGSQVSSSKILSEGPWCYHQVNSSFISFSRDRSASAAAASGPRSPAPRSLATVAAPPRTPPLLGPGARPRAPGNPPNIFYSMSAARLSAVAQSTVYAFSARPLAGGEPVSLGSLRGKVLLIENVASL